MRIAAPLLIVISLAILGCRASGYYEQPTPSLEAPTAIPATATATPSPGLPTALATSLPSPTEMPTIQPTPTLFSEVLGSVPTTPLPPPVTIAPQPEPPAGGTVLPVPEGTSVAWGGCASDGHCEWFNFYWAPTHEAVLQNGEAEIKVQHELCHAHQHWSVNGGEPLSPSDYDLESWYETAEGHSFVSAVRGLPWPWSHSAVSGLEDFAWTCAYWYLQPADLRSISPERYAWASEHLP